MASPWARAAGAEEWLLGEELLACMPERLPRQLQSFGLRRRRGKKQVYKANSRERASEVYLLFRALAVGRCVPSKRGVMEADSSPASVS